MVNVNVIQQLENLRHAAGYGEDLNRELSDLHERLKASLEETGAVEVEPIEMGIYNQAKNSLLSSLRYLREFEDAGGIESVL